jgi:hypothetical protein
MKSGTSLGHNCINGKYSVRECRQNITVHPGTENFALLPITPLNQEHSYFQLQN